MIVVIQCAAGKRADAGHIMTASGEKVLFVAQPEIAPKEPGVVYVRPDDISDNGETWRQRVLNYNLDNVDNPLGLMPAWQLYKHPCYAALAEKIGHERLYILSAGWGLIRSDFLTPVYDITFSNSADRFKKRRRKDVYYDLQQLPGDVEEDVLFFGGKDYLPLFCELTESIGAARTVYYNSQIVPEAPGCGLVKFETSTRTNWHYGAVQSLVLNVSGGTHG